MKPTPGSQLALFAKYSYHGFITDRDGELLELEADHRRHAEIENAIRDLKYGVGLNHLPSGRFAANGAWLAVQTMAHNLARWTARIGLGERIATTKTLRRRFFSLAGRLTRSARRLTLHLPDRWPWAEKFSRALARLRAIPTPGLTAPSATDPPTGQPKIPADSCQPGPREFPAAYSLAIPRIAAPADGHRGPCAAMKTVRRPPYPKWNPGYFPCSSLTPPSAFLTPSIGVLRWIRAKATCHCRSELTGPIAARAPSVQKRAFGGEDLDPMSSALCDVNSTIWPNDDPRGRTELATLASRGPPLPKRHPFRRELLHSIPPELRSIDLIFRVYSDPVWAIELHPSRAVAPSSHLFPSWFLRRGRGRRLKRGQSRRRRRDGCGRWCRDTLRSAASREDYRNNDWQEKYWTRAVHG